MIGSRWTPFIRCTESGHKPAHREATPEERERYMGEKTAMSTDYAKGWRAGAEECRRAIHAFDELKVEADWGSSESVAGNVRNACAVICGEVAVAPCAPKV